MLSKYKVSQAHNKAIFLFSQYGHRYGCSRSRTTQPKEEHVDRSFRECENSKDANDECLMWRLRRYATSFIICVTTRITKDTDGHWGPFNICPSQPAEWKEMAGLVKFISQHGRVPCKQEPAWTSMVHAGACGSTHAATCLRYVRKDTLKATKSEGGLSYWSGIFFVPRKASQSP